MRYIQIVLCVILLIQIGGMARRKTDVREGNYWIWNMYAKTYIIFSLALKNILCNDMWFYILYHVCLVHTLIYEVKKSDWLDIKILWTIGCVFLSVLMILA